MNLCRISVFYFKFCDRESFNQKSLDKRLKGDNKLVVESGVWSAYALADDIQLVFHGAQPRDALQMIIHETLGHFELWMKPKSMPLNSSKSKMMRFGTMGLGDMRIQLGRSELQSVENVRCDTVGCDYSHHHDGIYSRVCFTLRRMYCLNPYDVMQKVAHALIISPISYCVEECTEKQM
uniref:Uncharacterized protein n=1 Tax=Glossina austeni TaxID=7395 RepID=A0A1A9UGK3_GLOAU